MGTATPMLPWVVAAAASWAVAACTIEPLDPEGKSCPCGEGYVCVAGQCTRLDEPNSDYAMVVLADAPIAYYPMDETDSSVVVDATGNGNDGSFVTGATPGAPGIASGTAIRLDGSGGRLRFGDRFDFPDQTAFTLEVWIEPDVIGPFQRILTKEEGDVAGRQGYTVFLSRDDMPHTVGFERWRDGNLPGGVHTDEAIVAGQPLHVVVVYDGSRSAIYLDGEESQRTSNSAALVDRSAPFVLGASSSQDSGFFGGVVDELAVYDRALEPDRIRAHHDAGR